MGRRERKRKIGRERKKEGWRGRKRKREHKTNTLKEINIGDGRETVRETEMRER